MSVKVWKEGEAGEPSFPADFVVNKKAVLQVTDITNNNNKYYAIELHTGKNKFRVYTHYGRTDDLETNPRAGKRECRYVDTLGEAEALYASIFKEKTGPRKGYKEVNLASSKIGSAKAVGQSCGTIDDGTLKKIAEKDGGKKTVIAKPTLSPALQEIVDYLYAEAVNALTTTVNVSITANGIETPLGVLTLGQIEKGQGILDQIAGILNKGGTASKNALVELSGDFYTTIPAKIGRSREAVAEAVIKDGTSLSAKNDTLQLMRDMLNVNGDQNVLISPEIEKKYKALNCTIEPLTANDASFKQMKHYIESSATRYNKVTVKNIWKISRPDELKTFRKEVGNIKQLFHGSAVKNWVGILSRGLLLPKVVVTLGVKRTDAGWLGSGIYFGSEACTTLIYAHPGRRSTRFMTVADVALGKVKQYRKITYDLSKPPDGFDSCHGVAGSEFSDNELVVYDNRQQKLEYLVEYTG